MAAILWLALPFVAAILYQQFVAVPSVLCQNFKGACRFKKFWNPYIIPLLLHYFVLYLYYTALTTLFCIPPWAIVTESICPKQASEYKCWEAAVRRALASVPCLFVTPGQIEVCYMIVCLVCWTTWPLSDPASSTHLPIVLKPQKERLTIIK